MMRPKRRSPTHRKAAEGGQRAAMAGGLGESEHSPLNGSNSRPPRKSPRERGLRRSTSFDSVSSADSASSPLLAMGHHHSAHRPKQQRGGSKRPSHCKRRTSSSTGLIAGTMTAAVQHGKAAAAAPRRSSVYYLRRTRAGIRRLLFDRRAAGVLLVLFGMSFSVAYWTARRHQPAAGGGGEGEENTNRRVSTAEAPAPPPPQRRRQRRRGPRLRGGGGARGDGEASRTLVPLAANARQQQQQQQQQEEERATKYPKRSGPVPPSLLRGGVLNDLREPVLAPALLHAPSYSSSSSTTNDASSPSASAEGYPPFRRHTAGAPTCAAIGAAENVEFTLVTQLSANRLWMMEHHCARWPGPISAAVFATGGEGTLSEDDVLEQLVSLGCETDRLTVQTVSGYSEEEYPVNVLRNVALSEVKTSHVVYVDVDFWESSNLYDSVMSHREFLARDPKSALVMAAFQIHRQCREWRDCQELNVPVMPHTKDELLDLMLERVANAFDPTNIGGHGSTRYQDWLDQGEDELLPIECVKSNRYEPYLVFQYCHELPPFQEAFTGYGKNKMTWIMQLRRSGYQLFQLGSSFVVHYPHLDSKARMTWNGGENGAQLRKPVRGDLSQFKRAQVDRTFVAFREWLAQHVPDQTVIGRCEDALNDDAKLWIDRNEHTDAR